uniref:hypothetical protein n=2 Tax=Erwinia TaxID=551 RepID=UPI001F52D3BD
KAMTMAVNLNRLTTGTMNVNAGHKRTSKARIIHQIQPIRGITDFSTLAIQTSNKYLGVEMYYEKQRVKPGDSIRTQLQGGLGESQFKFVLIKKQGKDVSKGPFTGSAVLVMSAD